MKNDSAISLQNPVENSDLLADPSIQSWALVKILFTISLLTVSVQLPLNARADAYGSGWYGEMQFSVAREDNIARSPKKEDLQPDIISSISIGGGYSQKIGNASQMVVSAYLTYNRHEDFEDIDNLAASLGFRYIFQPTIGFNQLWYEVKFNATALEYKDSDIREGVLFDMDLSLNRRLTNRTSGHLGYRYSDLVFFDSKPKDETAFDTASSEIYASADYQIASSVFLFAEYGFRHGGFTSTVSDSPSGAIYEAESQDPVFDRCVGNRCPSWYSYRSIADVQHVDLGIAFPIKVLNVDLSGRYFEADGDVDTYRNWMVQLGIVWNF